MGLPALANGAMLAATLLMALAVAAFATAHVRSRSRDERPPSSASGPRSAQPGRLGRLVAVAVEQSPSPEAAAVSVADQPAFWTRLGQLLTGLGAALLAFSLTCLTIVAGRAPVGNMFEFAISSAFTCAVVFLVIARRTGQAQQLGVLALLPTTVTLMLALALLETDPDAPLVAALQSAWLNVHVTAAALGVGLVTVGAVACLLQIAAQRRADPVMTARSERVARLAFALALPVWTFAVMTGAIWAHRAWGRYWGWDPKEVWALITWIMIAAFLHARHTAGVRRGTASVIGVIAYGTLVINFIVINLWADGLHSYAGV